MGTPWCNSLFRWNLLPKFPVLTGSYWKSTKHLPFPTPTPATTAHVSFSSHDQIKKKPNKQPNHLILSSAGKVKFWENQISKWPDGTWLCGTVRGTDRAKLLLLKIPVGNKTKASRYPKWTCVITYLKRERGTAPHWNGLIHLFRVNFTAGSKTPTHPIVRKNNEE